MTDSQRDIDRDTGSGCRVGISDGNTVAVGQSMRARAIATPGHTFTHMGYAREDATTGEVEAVLTGGLLLHGSTGLTGRFGSTARGGYRASIAASLPQAAGHTVTAVDDDFARAASAGVTVTRAPRRPAAKRHNRQAGMRA